MTINISRALDMVAQSNNKRVTSIFLNGGQPAAIIDCCVTSIPFLNTLDDVNNMWSAICNIGCLSDDRKNKINAFLGHLFEAWDNNVNLTENAIKIGFGSNGEQELSVKLAKLFVKESNVQHFYMLVGVQDKFFEKEWHELAVIDLSNDDNHVANKPNFLGTNHFHLNTDFIDKNAFLENLIDHDDNLVFDEFSNKFNLKLYHKGLDKLLNMNDKNYHLCVFDNLENEFLSLQKQCSDTKSILRLMAGVKLFNDSCRVSKSKEYCSGVLTEFMQSEKAGLIASLFPDWIEIPSFGVQLLPHDNGSILNIRFEFSMPKDVAVNEFFGDFAPEIKTDETLNDSMWFNNNLIDCFNPYSRVIVFQFKSHFGYISASETSLFGDLLKLTPQELRQNLAFEFFELTCFFIPEDDWDDVISDESIADMYGYQERFTSILSECFMQLLIDKVNSGKNKKLTLQEFCQEMALLCTENPLVGFVAFKNARCFKYLNSLQKEQLNFDLSFIYKHIQVICDDKRMSIINLLNMPKFMNMKNYYLVSNRSAKFGFMVVILDSQKTKPELKNVFETLGF